MRNTGALEILDGGCNINFAGGGRGEKKSTRYLYRKEKEMSITSTSNEGVEEASSKLRAADSIRIYKLQNC